MQIKLLKEKERKKSKRTVMHRKKVKVKNALKKGDMKCMERKAGVIGEL
jgi:hypothetical protein